MDLLTKPIDFRGNQPRSTRDLVLWCRRERGSPVIDPGLPIVDPHHHLFGTREDILHYELEDLTQDLSDGHHVLGTVYVEAYEAGWRRDGPQAFRPVGEVERIVELTSAPIETKAGSCQVAAGIVCHVDMTLGEQSAEVLDAQVVASEGRLRGVRHRTAVITGSIEQVLRNQPRQHLLSQPEFRRGVAQLHSRGLSFDVWVYHTQLAELISFVDAFPDTTIVVDHIGGPVGVAEFRPHQAQIQKDWAEQIRELARRPHVFLKVGGMGMPIFGFGFEQRGYPPTASDLTFAWTPYIETCVNAFGSARCMFESNFPVDKQSCSYLELWNAFKLVTRGWSSKERSDLFYRSACRAYRLPQLEFEADQLMVKA